MAKLDFDINVGVGDFIDPNKRDGVAWVKSTDNGYTQKSFIVDCPNKLQTLNSTTVTSMFDQFLKMGMLPVYLEIFCGNVRKLYKYGYPDMPVFVEAL